ncbi:MAG: hypothetical protein JWM16_2729 [Verrucomicrobiales bacterium]|nr:hypothetical protein [Verrucomicrobiales bacterium]
MRHTFITFLSSRPVVFFLAFLSFACLLGNFYGYWTMHAFGCWVLPPSTGLLIAVGWLNRHRSKDLDNAGLWVVHGAIGGLVAAVAYDLYRLPFVLNGAPLFQVFPKFGELLLGSPEPRWLVHTLGWSYHFSNGAALGIMFLAMLTAFRRPNFLPAAIGWALFVETMLLLTPYASFFGLPLNGQFLFLTVSAHLIFGVVLGIYCQKRMKPLSARA